MQVTTPENIAKTAPLAIAEENGEQSLRAGIEFFEQTLEVIPGDRTALEFLSIAYEQTGEAEKQGRALTMLAKTLIGEGDTEAALGIAERLETLGSAAARAAVLNIRARCAPPAAANARPPSEQAVAEAVKSELELVRTLERRKVIEESVAKGIGEMLGALTKQRGTFLVSALVLLEHEYPDEAEKAALITAEAADTPPLPVGIFRPRTDLLARLPRLLVRVRGVFPFAEMGGVPLVAVANPHDKDLRARVEELLGAECRFYLALPRDVEDMLEELPPEKEAEEAVSA